MRKYRIADDLRIQSAIRGLQIPIMKIVDVSRTAREAIAGGADTETLRSVMVKFVESLRC